VRGGAKSIERAGMGKKEGFTAEAQRTQRFAEKKKDWDWRKEEPDGCGLAARFGCADRVEVGICWSKAAPEGAALHTGVHVAFIFP